MSKTTKISARIVGDLPETMAVIHNTRHAMYVQQTDRVTILAVQKQ